MTKMEVKDELKELNIGDLRNLGRVVGVHAPAALKKKALIDGIERIMDGGTREDPDQPRRGQPAKTTQLSDALNRLVTEILHLNGINAPYAKTLEQTKSVLHASEKPVAPVVYETLTVQDGRLLVNALGDGEVFDRKMESIAFLTRDLVARYALASGMIIEGIVKTVNTRREMTEIHMIQGVPAQEFVRPAQRQRVNAMQAFFSETAPLCFYPIVKGSVSLIKGGRASGKSTLLASIAAEMKKNGAEPIVLMIDAVDYLENVYQKLTDTTVFTTAVDGNLESKVRYIRFAVERSLRVAETGRDVVLLFDSLTNYLKLNSRLTGDRQGTGYRLTELAVNHEIYQELYGYLKQAYISSRGSLTIIASMDDVTAVDQAFCADFERFASTVVTLDQKLARRGLFPAIDVEECYTREMSRLLDEEKRERFDAMMERAEGKDAVGIWKESIQS